MLGPNTLVVENEKIVSVEKGYLNPESEDTAIICLLYTSPSPRD